MLRKHKSFLIYHAFKFCQAVWMRHKIEFLIIHFMGEAMPLIFFFSTFRILSSYLLLVPLFSHIIIRCREKHLGRKKTLLQFVFNERSLGFTLGVNNLRVHLSISFFGRWSDAIGQGSNDIFILEEKGLLFPCDST